MKKPEREIQGTLNWQPKWVKLCKRRINMAKLSITTGKSLSEALFASANPQYDDSFFIELQVQYMRIPSSNLGRTCCVQKLFLTFRTIIVHNIFSPCSAKKKRFWQRFTCTFQRYTLFTVHTLFINAHLISYYCYVQQGFLTFLSVLHLSKENHQVINVISNA